MRRLPANKAAIMGCVGDVAEFEDGKQHQRVWRRCSFRTKSPALQELLRHTHAAFNNPQGRQVNAPSALQPGRGTRCGIDIAAPSASVGL